MAHKSLSRVEIKSADKGEVSAVFATFNVKDSDGDVTLPGAFTDGAPVVISAYNHGSWGGSLPVGKGKIRLTKAEAIMDGQFFMDTPDGRNTFTIVKALAESGLGDWSYGYNIIDGEHGTFDGEDVQFLKRLDVYETSPVLKGAGVNTRTLATKALVDHGMDPKDAVRLVERTAGVSEYKAAIRPHETAVSTKAWEGKQVVAELAPDASIADFRSLFAWCDPTGDPEAKSSYRFPHHDGPQGEANLRACLAHIATLNSGKSGIPDEDRRGVYNHLAAHLQDGDREPPELRTDHTSTLKFYDEAAAVMASVSGLVDRASEVMALRAAKGKSLAATSMDVLEWLYDEMRRLRSVLDSPQDDAAREYVRFVHSQQSRGDST
jgi:hypothetical protein